MNVKLLTTITLLCFSVAWPVSGYTQLSIGDIAANVLPSIVVIEGDSSIGSGVLIDSSGVIATNFHVIEDSSAIRIVLEQGDTYSDVSVIDFDINRDIAILKVAGFDLPIAPLGNSNSVGVGDDVVVMGSPRGFDQTVTRGIVSAIRESGEGYTLFQTDAAISPGSSGGGMFDEAGNLIGITVSYIEDAQNVNFVIPINYVRGMLIDEPKYSWGEFLETTDNQNRADNSNVTTNIAGIDFGDNTSQWANDGECDDPRFEGVGMATTAIDDDLRSDATDCSEAYQDGSIALIRDFSLNSNAETALFSSLDELFNQFNASALDYQFERNDDDVWVMQSEENVVIAAAEEFGMVTTVLFTGLTRDDIKNDLAVKLLEANYQITYAKIILMDDDITIVHEAEIDGLTVQNYGYVLAEMASALVDIHELFSLPEDLTSEIEVVRTNGNEQPSTDNTNDSSSPSSLAPNKPSLLEDAIIRLYPKKGFLDERFSVKFDQSRWELDADNTVSIDDDFQYVSVGENAWIRIIAEEPELSYEYMRDVIVANAQNADPNAKLTETGFRDVNNIRVMWATVDARVSNIPITYFYHIYTGIEGTVQIISFSARNLFESRIGLVEEVVSSFIIQP